MNRSHHAFNTVSNSIPFNSSNVKKTRTPRKCIHKTKSIHTTPPHTYADCKKNIIFSLGQTRSQSLFTFY